MGKGSIMNFIICIYDPILTAAYGFSSYIGKKKNKCERVQSRLTKINQRVRNLTKRLNLTKVTVPYCSKQRM